MQRKAIQIANSTLLVSLPKKWVVKVGLKKGDAVDIEEEKRGLLLTSKASVEDKKIELDVSSMDRDFLMFLVRSLYKKGYNEMKLTFNNLHVPHTREKKELRTIDVISHEVLRLMGVDIFKHSDNYCLIKSITTESNKEFENILRRIFLLTEEIIADFRDGLADNNVNILKSIQLKHDTITTLLVYSERILNKSGYGEKDNDCIFYHILELIDQLVDAIKLSARLALSNKLTLNKEAIKAITQISEMYSKSYKLFYKFKIESLSEINKDWYGIRSQLSDASSKLNKKEINILSYMSQVSEYVRYLVISFMSYHL